MPTVKNFVATIVLSAALLCFVAAGAADTEFAIQLEQQPVTHIAKMHCRIYFGCLPLDRMPVRRPLSNGQE